MSLGARSGIVFKGLYCVLLCIALLCGAIALVKPEKTFQIYPYEGSVAHLYADSVEPNGLSTAVWVDRSSNSFECNVGYGVPYPYCGIVIKHKRTDSKNYYVLDLFEFDDAATIDLSSYDGMYVSLEYSGPSESLYFFIRNAKEKPTNFAEYETMQFMHVDFKPADTEIFIDFSRIQVARWWIDRYGSDPITHKPTLTDVYDMGIELPALPAEGVHRLKLKRIAAKKAYVSQRQLYFIGTGVLGIACFLLMVQGLLYYHNRENESLRTKMVVDPLTQCLNRLGLETAVKGVFPLSNSASVYVMVLDLDHFKKINDTLGHAAGDEVLRKASMVLSQELRSDDVFGRWGGEEFIIISRVTRDALENMISRLMRSLRNVSIDGSPEPYTVSMSIGVTEARLGESFDEVFRRADEAMYQVKQAGRGSWKLV